MDCPKCGKETPEESLFCKHCGTQVQLKVKCAACENQVTADSQFCLYCGAQIRLAKQIVIQPPTFGHPEAQRVVHQPIFDHREKPKYEWTVGRIGCAAFAIASVIWFLAWAGSGAPRVSYSNPLPLARIEMVKVDKCEPRVGAGELITDYGIAIGCTIQNVGPVSGNANVMFSVEQQSIVTDRKTKGIFLQAGEKAYVEETLWGAKLEKDPTRCNCRIQ